MTKIKITADDCRSCGACCISRSDEVLHHGYADLETKDATRLSPHVRRQLLNTAAVGGEPRYSTTAKEIADGRYSCRYLRGTPGERCSCSIYATRPSICQDFRVGGQRCQQARAAAMAYQEPAE